MSNASAKRRLFVGIALDESVRRACAAISKRLEATGFKARYEDAAKLHVTLAFLGNVVAARVDEIAAAMRSAVERCTRFEVGLDKLGAFPHERKPFVVYIGARDQGSGFRSLAGEVREAYRPLGFEWRDDPLLHVTIARATASHHALPLVEFAPVGLIVSGVTLFESLFESERETTRYEILSSVPLAPERV